MYLWEEVSSGSSYSAIFAMPPLFGKLLILVHSFLHNQPSFLHMAPWEQYVELLLYIYLGEQFLFHKIQIPSPLLLVTWSAK